MKLVAIMFSIKISTKSIGGFVFARKLGMPLQATQRRNILSGATNKLEVYNELEAEKERNGYPDEDFHAQKNCFQDPSMTDVTR